MKKRSYKLSLPRWALAQRESWYAELAARGLRVQKAGAMLTRFAPAPPARLRYRFEVGSDEGGLPAGQKEFYEECGWQYVLNDRPLHLFCAPEHTDAPDLHTDPAALADSLKTLRGSILSQALGTALWALLMFAQLTYLGRYTLELVLADAAAPLGLSAWEAGYADGTQDTVYLVQRYCRLSGAGGAKAFGRGLARRLWLLEPEEYTVLKETPDTLVLANYEDGPGFHQTLLLVVDGPDVLFLHYWGGGARSADVGAAAQARFAEYTAAARGR